MSNDDSVARAKSILTFYDYCLTHLIKKHAVGSTLVCPLCAGESRIKRETEIANAIAIIKESRKKPDGN